MASSPANPSAVPDQVGSVGRIWRGGPDARFEWIAPSPSPAEVAELERLFPDIIQLPERSLEVEAAAWESSSLIARSLSRWVPPEAIIRELRRAGVPGEVEAVNLAHKHYILRFHDLQARDLVLHRPWVVNGQPIAVAEWQAEFVPGNDTLLSALLWIRLPLLPLDFWSDEILALILSAAGEFQFADDATKMKNRGGFARACVRVDLGSPLRPGVRIRGSKDPFWQQFSYENVDGICPSCASLHLVDSCRVEPELVQSQAAPRFGSWMAAVRRRKSPMLQASAPRTMAQGDVKHSPASDNGWQLPKKPARRSGRGVQIAGQASSSFPRALEQEKEVSIQPCRFSPAVPVSDSKSQTGSQRVEVVQPVVKILNPFSALHSDSDTRSSDCCLVSTPVTSKRGRPIEARSQSCASKGSNSKCKGPHVGKGKGPVSFTFSAASDSVRGAGVQARRGAKKLRGLAEPTLGTTSGGPLQEPRGEIINDVVSQPKQSTMHGDIEVELESSLPSSVSGMDHDSVVSRLKKAIQHEDSVTAMDLARDECQGSRGWSDLEPGGSHNTSKSIVVEMYGDLEEVPPTQSTE